jgi:hypothetical protein
MRGFPTPSSLRLACDLRKNMLKKDQMKRPRSFKGFAAAVQSSADGGDAA